MQEPGTYQTRIFDYGGVDRSVGDAALASLCGPRFTVRCSGSAL